MANNILPNCLTTCRSVFCYISDIYLLLKLHIEIIYMYTYAGNCRHGRHSTYNAHVFFYLLASLIFLFFIYIHFQCYFVLHVVNLETPKHERHIVVIIIIVCLDDFQANASSKQKVPTRMHTVCSVFWIIYQRRCDKLMCLSLGDTIVA